MSAHNQPRRSAGFSLIELAVVLVIIGLLIGGGVAAFDATRLQSQRSDVKHELQLVREALYGFAMSHDRLPCPDDPDEINDPDGLENHSGSPATCDSDHGALPWETLGLARRDPWGNPYYYHVEQSFAAGPDTTIVDWRAFLLDDGATIKVVDGNDQTMVSDTPAVVVSFAEQGGQVWRESGLDCSSAATTGFSDDEIENCDGDDKFVAAGYRAADASAGRFDDLLIWLPDPVLKAHMVDAERLPP